MLAELDWGRREYADSLQEMRRLRSLRVDGVIPDTLILVEHPPVYTIGVQGADGDVFPPGVPVVQVERGGKATYHGPGQLVGYLLIDLRPRGHDVRRFVHEVEELVVRACRTVGLPSERVPGRRGVWVDGKRKVASVGVAIERWVSFHGFALNVSTDLASFGEIHPCGFDPDVMTSVERELGRPVALEELKAPVVDAFRGVFATPAPTEARASGLAAPA